MFLRTGTALSCVALLSACGGSSTSGPEPIMSAGFASATTDYSQPYEFSDDDTVLIRLSDDDASVETVTISLKGTPRDGPVELILDGESYTLERDEVTNRLSFTSDDVRVVSFLMGQLSNTGIYYIDRISEEEFIGGFHIFGYDTDPREILPLTGDATYSGPAEIALRNGDNFAFGSGGADLSIDFDENTVGGSIAVSDNQQPNATMAFPDISITLNDTAITGNRFRGTTDAQSSADGDTFSEGAFSGRFYESEGAVAAGQFSGAIDAPGLDERLVYEGTFITQE